MKVLFPVLRAETRPSEHCRTHLSMFVIGTILSVVVVEKNALLVHKKAEEMTMEPVGHYDFPSRKQFESAQHTLASHHVPHDGSYTFRSRLKALASLQPFREATVQPEERREKHTAWESRCNTINPVSLFYTWRKSRQPVAG